MAGPEPCDAPSVTAPGVRGVGGAGDPVSASEKLPSGERIDVIHPRPLFRRILDLCRPSGVPTLIVVERTRQ